MQNDNSSTIYAIAVGVVSSLLAAAVLEWRAPRWTWTLLLLAGALSTVLLWLVWRSLQTLRSVGIRRWELKVEEGTGTQEWIRRSQRTVSFMGLACTKWLSDGRLLRQMLVRHASNGGEARFLLLDPDSSACTEMEAIKQQQRGSLAALIRKNAATLLALRDENLHVEVRYYSDTPRFRIVIIDDVVLALTLYSYSSEVGHDSPQLIFDCERERPWSFYYAFNAFFVSQWERAKIVGR